MLYMERPTPGQFSQSFLSLQLQLRTLLEGSGGNASIEFLDSLSKLGKLEQDVVLSVFQKVIERIASGSQRVFTEEDKIAKDFEDNLYKDIMTAMSEAASVKNLNGKRLEVLQGGQKKKDKKAPIDLSKVRKSRSNTQIKPVLN